MTLLRTRSWACSRLKKYSLWWPRRLLSFEVQCLKAENSLECSFHPMQHLLAKCSWEKASLHLRGIFLGIFDREVMGFGVTLQQVKHRGLCATQNCRNQYLLMQSRYPRNCQKLQLQIIYYWMLLDIELQSSFWCQPTNTEIRKSLVKISNHQKNVFLTRKMEMK